jgi:hypothetical protein
VVLFICSTTRTRSSIYIIIVLGIVKKDFLFISRDDATIEYTVATGDTTAQTNGRHSVTSI